MGEVTTADRTRFRRKVRLVVVGGVTGAVLMVLAGFASALYGSDRIPAWGLALAFVLVAAVGVPLLVLGVREFAGVVQQDVLAPYDVRAPASAGLSGGLGGLVVVLLVAVLVTDVLTGAVRWTVVGILAAAAVLLLAFGWRAGARSRQQVKDVRRERGYLAGEQPWSWSAHAGYGAMSIGLIALQVGNGLFNDSVERWRWFFWAAALMFVALSLSIAWSVMQKWRRERRGVTRVRETA